MNAAPFTDYIRAGFGLCALQAGTKRPAGSDWLKSPLREVSTAANLASAGLVHEASGTCAIDVDDLAEATRWFGNRAVDLDALLTSGVRIVSGRNNRAKLLYRLPPGVDPLPTRKVHAADGHVVLELRCAGAQDVLPPSVHPDTGMPYMWEGDWQDLPQLPPQLLSVWGDLSRLNASNTTSTTGGTDIERLRLHVAAVRKANRDAYDPWLKVGMAIHLESGGREAGLELWDEWSRDSPKYRGAEDLERRYNGFGKHSDRAQVTLGTLKGMADHNDPDCLAAIHKLAALEFEDLTFERVTEGETSSRSDHPWAQFRDINALPPAPEFIIPGFIGTGIVGISGAPGVGKTTAVVPLAMIAAGLHRPSDPLAPEHWRQVIYIAEDADQVIREAHAVAIGLSLDMATVAQRFHVVAAHRLEPGKAAKVGAEYRERFTRVVDGVDIEPLVVIDTTAAALALENENDNAAISGAIAAFKQQFAGLPTWLIGHTAKTDWGAVNSDGLSARGGGAWVADVHQQLFLTEGDNGRRLKLGKRRFEPTWQELEIVGHLVQLSALDKFGRAHAVDVRWGSPQPGRPEVFTRASMFERVVGAIVAIEANDGVLPTAMAGRTTARSVLRKHGLRLAEAPKLGDLLHEAEEQGLIRCEAFTNSDSKTKPVWRLTDAGRAMVDLPFPPGASSPTAGA